MSLTISLKQFLEDEKNRLAAFDAWWTSKLAEGALSEDGTPIFPNELQPGEWDEQYHLFDQP